MLHEARLSALPGPVLRLEGDRSVAEQLAQIERAIEGGLPCRSRAAAND